MEHHNAFRALKGLQAFGPPHRLDARADARAERGCSESLEIRIGVKAGLADAGL